jgi:microcompartment protein CcmL/EutN
MGAGQFMIETTGRSAHVGRAFTDGISAVTKLAECLVKIGEMPDPNGG